MDEKPKTSHLILKPKTIVPTDVPARPGDGTAISVKLIHSANALAEARAREDAKAGRSRPPIEPPPAEPLPKGFRAKEVTPTDAPAVPDDPEAIRVEDILAVNRAADDRAGLTRLDWFRRRRSRRNQDFLMVLGFMGLLAFLAYRSAPGLETLVFGSAAFVLVGSMTAWFLYVVMDRY